MPPPAGLPEADGLPDAVWVCDGFADVAGGGGADDGAGGGVDGVGVSVGVDDVTGDGVAVALTYTGGSNVSFGMPSVATFM